MKRYLLIPGGAVILSACGVGTQIYNTPPLYFGSSHTLPLTDSARQLSVSASFIIPPAAELRGEYRINRNFSTNLSYFGNGGFYSYSKSNDIRYKYKTSFFDFGTGYINSPGDGYKTVWYIAAGYGSGKTVSVVPEFDNSKQFIYRGSFSRFTFTPGIHVITGKKSSIDFTWRQSFVSTSKYELPDTSYPNQKQFLTDIILKFWGEGIRRYTLQLFYWQLFERDWKWW